MRERKTRLGKFRSSGSTPGCVVRTMTALFHSQERGKRGVIKSDLCSTLLWELTRMASFGNQENWGKGNIGKHLHQ